MCTKAVRMQKPTAFLEVTIPPNSNHTQNIINT